MKLKNKVSIVTGAGRGMGKAVAELFAEEGSWVVLADINEKLGRNTSERINNSGWKSIFIRTDVSDPKDVKDLVKKTLDNFGNINILVNNAAMTFVASVHESTIEDWNRVIEVTLSSVFLCSKFVLPIMLKNKEGVIINIASNVYFLATKRCAAYVAAKSGVVGLTKQMALDYCLDNIRVNAICPGWTRTEMAEEYINARENPEEVRKSILNTIPIKKMAEPEEIASKALFLASDDSSHIIGTTITIDGGETIIHP